MLRTLKIFSQTKPPQSTHDFSWTPQTEPRFPGLALRSTILMVKTRPNENSPMATPDPAP
jgi:hypothetical protein